MSKKVIPFITNWNKSEILNAIKKEFPKGNFRIGMRYYSDSIDDGYDVILIINDHPTTITLKDDEAIEEIIQEVSLYFSTT